MSNTPMSYFNFHRYISNLQKQSDWIDNLYKCDIDGIADKIVSYDDTLELIQYIFHDYLDLLDIWIYDNNYGRENHVKIIYNHKQYNTEEEIYELLCKIFNKEIMLGDIQYEYK